MNTVMYQCGYNSSGMWLIVYARASENEYVKNLSRAKYQVNREKNFISYTQVDENVRNMVKNRFEIYTYIHPSIHP